jgi:hypothetical protein
MMKEVCKTCIVRHCGHWSWNDEQNWDHNKILCPVVVVACSRDPSQHDAIYTRGPVPVWCQYALENVVLEQRP